MQRVFTDPEAAMQYAADVEAHGLKAAITSVAEGPKHFFVVRLTRRPLDRGDPAGAARSGA